MVRGLANQERAVKAQDLRVDDGFTHDGVRYRVVRTRSFVDAAGRLVIGVLAEGHGGLRYVNLPAGFELVEPCRVMGFGS